jgi:hypothetical protein
LFALLLIALAIRLMLSTAAGTGAWTRRSLRYESPKPQ